MTVSANIPIDFLSLVASTGYGWVDLRDEISDVLAVEAFTNHHMRVFLQGWPVHKGRSAIALYGLIQGDPQIRDICRNPLLLTILTGLYLDTDDFQIPASRELFYQSAVEELLSRRPARRQIKQEFDPNDKRQILERVSLARLETVAQNEDPEELTQQAVREKAIEVLRNDKFDFRALVSELVEINAIIRPVSDDSYTCAHRTIQEYFASREALRSRETSNVVATFSERLELIEVLYFYCGLLNNLPSLKNILEGLIAKRRWLDAGRCLLFMKEAPSGELVSAIASQLYNDLVAGVEIKSSIEVLSSLANRSNPEFASARPLFDKAVEQLVKSSESGAFALESAIATSPEIARKLIPGLLNHSSERWKAAAVQLLRDIGTDEALDDLVRLLRDDDAYVRRRVALLLAEMIKSRNRALRQRAVLLPKRADKEIWPLELYFPGSIALPIIDALAPDETSSCEAINEGIRASNFKDRPADDRTLREWRRVVLDASLWNFRLGAGRVAVRLGLAIILTTFGVVAIFGGGSFLSGRVVFAKPFSAPHVVTIDANLLDLVFNDATALREKIVESFPPKSSGWLRLLPWNWDASPKLPDSKTEAFNALTRWANGWVDPFQVDHNRNMLSDLATLVSASDIQDLKRAVESVENKFAAVSGLFLFVDMHRWSSVVFLFFYGLGVAFCCLGFRNANVEFRTSRTASAVSGHYFQRLLPMVAIQLMIAGGLSLEDHVYSSSTAMTGLMIFGGVGVLVLRYLLNSAKWPSNPFLETVNEVREETV